MPFTSLGSSIIRPRPYLVPFDAPIQRFSSPVKSVPSEPKTRPALNETPTRLLPPPKDFRLSPASVSPCSVAPLGLSFGPPLPPLPETIAAIAVAPKGFLAPAFVSPGSGAASRPLLPCHRCRQPSLLFPFSYHWGCCCRRSDCLQVLPASFIDVFYTAAVAAQSMSPVRRGQNKVRRGVCITSTSSHRQR